MKKILLLLIFLPLLSIAQEFSISDYFYPLYKFQYTIQLAGTQSSFVRNEYKISNASNCQFLEVKTELYQNAFNHTTTAQQAFVISKDKTRNAIISDFQVYYNALTGPQERTDHLTLFILPEKNKVEKWFETDREEKFSCTAEYVYISFNGFQSEQKATAVKITKIQKINNEEIKYWSYWLPNYSRIATFVQHGKGDVRVVEVSDMIDIDASIEEISKSLNLNYEEPQNEAVIKKGSRKSKSTHK